MTKRRRITPVSELYALRHSDISIADDPARLMVTVRNGKTGFRIANILPYAVKTFERIKARNPDAKPDDFLFLPSYDNRQTASKVMQRQFHALLARAGVERDMFTGQKHTMYSLRHTAICMRIITSEGKINIFNLAKNAGTSVDQIERFYAKDLPLSAELAKNLHTFNDEFILRDPSVDGRVGFPKLPPWPRRGR
jgi:hypothetical protein